MATELNQPYGTVTDGGGYHPFNNPSNTNDGNISTYAVRDAYVGNEIPRDCSLKTDLGSARNVSSMVIIAGWGGGDPNWTEVEWSTDGVSWNPVDNLSFSWDLPTVTTTATFDIQSARYWRITNYEAAAPFTYRPEISVWTWGIWIEELTANFTGTPTSGTRPLAVQFTDTSTGPEAVTSWQWDFGDGETSTEQNPLHVYSTAGTYTVTLIVGDGSSSDTETKTGYITVSVATAPAPTTTAVPGVWIDWNNNGVFDSAAVGDGRLARMMPVPGGTVGDLEDITDDCISVWGQEGGQFDTLAGQEPGTIVIEVRNDTGKYTPRNASSPLYGYLVPGRRVWIGATSGGNDYGVAAGYLKEIVPMPRVGRAQLIVEDPIGRWQRQPVAVGMAESVKASTYRRSILAQIGLPDAQIAIDGEPDILRLTGGQNRNAVSALQDINEATGTRHWTQAADSKDDHFYYRTGNRNRGLGGESPVVTLTDDDVTGVSGLRLTRETVFNVLRISPQRYTWLGSDVVWESPSVPFTVSSSAPKTISADYGTWIKDPTVAVEYAGDVATATLTHYGRTSEIRIVSAGVSVIRSVKVTGLAGELADIEVAVVRSQSSINTHEEREASPVATAMIDNAPQAEGIGNAIIYRTQDPRERPKVEIENRFDKSLITRVGDVIAYTNAEFGLSAVRFEVVGRTFRIDFGAKKWTFGWTLLETPLQSDLGFFTLDSSTLDGSDVLGF